MASMLSLVPTLQAKLRVGSSVDPAEHEADSVADRVVAMLNQPQPDVVDSQAATGPSAAPPTRIRRSTSPLQRRAKPVVGAEGGDIDGELAARVQHAGGGSALDSKIKARLEGAFGTTFDDVRVHRDSAIAPQIGARAFTFGNSIHFAPGEYNPSSKAGMHVLSHELTHVVQQSGGGVQASRIARVHSGTDTAARPSEPVERDCSPEFP